MVVTSRTTYVLARDRRAPVLLARTAGNGTPWVAVVLAGLCQVGMAVLSNLRFAVSATGFLDHLPARLSVPRGSCVDCAVPR